MLAVAVSGLATWARAEPAVKLIQSRGAAMIGATAVGIVAEDEFVRAQAAIGVLAGYCDYEDWLDARRGLQIGLAMAGADARMVVVDLSSFLGWRDRTGKPADERALDAFASLALRTSLSWLSVSVSSRAEPTSTHGVARPDQDGRHGAAGWVQSNASEGPLSSTSNSKPAIPLPASSGKSNSPPTPAPSA